MNTVEDIASQNMTIEIEAPQQKTMNENFVDGLKVMGIGMAAVFGVLFILYIVIKIMGYFAKGNENEKN